MSLIGAAGSNRGLIDRSYGGQMQKPEGTVVLYGGESNVVVRSECGMQAASTPTTQLDLVAIEAHPPASPVAAGQATCHLDHVG